ncbi:MAG: hypothetical protein CSB48_11775 [Proteobacteria bacterium]|nr:MAG: hypothetical protein CSB48_11775 [Pseudomonadota bacterium]
MFRSLKSLLIIFLLPYMAQGNDQNSGALSPKLSYMADVVQFNANFPAERQTSHVVMSRFGVRVETVGMFGSPGEVGVYIQNVESGHSWLVKPESKIFAPLGFNKDDNEDSKAAEKASGIMATNACPGDSSLTRRKHLGNKKYRGINVEVWSCGNDHFQFYSPYWGMVIREELPGRNVTELARLQRIEPKSALFQPPGEYSKVSLEEFYFGVGELPEYRESQPDQNAEL